MKIYSVSSCATRLYAIYEHFVETLVSDYLDAIPELCAFLELSESMRTEYRVGISHLLNRLDSPRYRHLSHINLIRWYHEALSAGTPYRFVPEALTRHDENLRLSVLNGILGRVQLSDLQGWLSHHAAIAGLFSEKTALWDQLESELKNFIQLRNDAAHGTLSELIGSESLLRQCDLIGAIIEALSAYLHHHVIVWRHKVGKARLLGNVTEVFDQHKAFIVPLLPGCSLSISGRVHLVGQWSCVEAVVESIRINDADTYAITAVGESLELGVVASVMPKRNVAIYTEV